MEKRILKPLLPGFEPAIFRSRVRRSNQQAIPAPGMTVPNTGSGPSAAWRHELSTVKETFTCVSCDLRPSTLMNISETLVQKIVSCAVFERATSSGMTRNLLPLLCTSIALVSEPFGRGWGWGVGWGRGGVGSNPTSQQGISEGAILQGSGAARFKQLFTVFLHSFILEMHDYSSLPTTIRRKHSMTRVVFSQVDGDKSDGCR